MEYFLLPVGILVGLLVAYFFIARLRTRLALMEQGKQHAEERTLEVQQQSEKQLATLREQFLQQTEAEQKKHAQQLEKAEQQYKEALGLMHRQHEEQMAQQMQLIKAEMNTASERILKKRAQQLSTTNKEQLSTILSPLQTHIQQMREAVEKSDREQTATMQRLDASIKTSFELSRKVGERADRLALALTGENKTQGNFGELKLKQLLEDMGLEEGVQFELQETMKDKDGRPIYEEEGHRMIPDAILHFPTNATLSSTPRCRSRHSKTTIMPKLTNRDKMPCSATLPACAHMSTSSQKRTIRATSRTTGADWTLS